MYASPLVRCCRLFICFICSSLKRIWRESSFRSRHEDSWDSLADTITHHKYISHINHTENTRGGGGDQAGFGVRRGREVEGACRRLSALVGV